MLTKKVFQDERVVAFLLQTLNVEESKSAQALICLGLAKLMLFGLVTDERVRFLVIPGYVFKILITLFFRS